MIDFCVVVDAVLRCLIVAMVCLVSCAFFDYDVGLFTVLRCFIVTLVRSQYFALCLIATLVCALCFAAFLLCSAVYLSLGLIGVLREFAVFTLLYRYACKIVFVHFFACLYTYA